MIESHKASKTPAHPMNILLDAAAMPRKTPDSLSLAADIEQTLHSGIPHDIVAVSAGADILRQGDSTDQTCLLLSGWAYRYKSLPDGRRQIIGFLLPGDLCSSWAAADRAMEHGVRALNAARVFKIDRNLALGLIKDNPRLLGKMLAAASQEHTILGAWLLNMGQRKAPERIAHLFCELATRMRKVGIERVEGAYEVPLTQQDLADSLGLTSVHVNRVLQRLREKNLIGFRRGMLSIKDVDALCAFVEFKDGYLSH